MSVLILSVLSVVVFDRAVSAPAPETTCAGPTCPSSDFSLLGVGTRLSKDIRTAHLEEEELQSTRPRRRRRSEENKPEGSTKSPSSEKEKPEENTESEGSTKSPSSEKEKPEENTKSASYQPAIPPAKETPDEFYTGGPTIGPMLGKICPPWMPNAVPGKHIKDGGCQSDSVIHAVRHIRPANRCKKGGVCTEAGMFGSCVTLNNKKFYPDYGESGFCFGLGFMTPNQHNIPYQEMTIFATRKDFIYLDATRWAQQDAPARLTCDSFCKKCDLKTAYCPDTTETPIASGEYGKCSCHCRAGAEAADFDRCTSVSAAVCSEKYCGANGEGTFHPIAGPDAGTCQCKCKSGFYGRNCELKDGDPCDINDCNHRGRASGIRPHCQCDCGVGIFNCKGSHCESCKFDNLGGDYPSTSTNFTQQAKVWPRDYMTGQEGDECACNDFKPATRDKFCLSKKFYQGHFGCLGQSRIIDGPAAYMKNANGLKCVTEGEKSYCRKE